MVGVAEPSAVSTTPTRFEEKAQIREPLCASGSPCTICLALDSAALTFAVKLTFRLCVQRCAITTEIGSRTWPWAYLQLRPAGRSCQRIGFKFEIFSLHVSKRLLLNTNAICAFKTCLRKIEFCTQCGVLLVGRRSLMTLRQTVRAVGGRRRAF